MEVDWGACPIPEPSRLEAPTVSRAIATFVGLAPGSPEKFLGMESFGTYLEVRVVKTYSCTCNSGQLALKGAYH